MDTDTAMAARFLSALTGDHNHTFQTFAEAGGATKACNRILHGSLERHANALASFNAKGAGVFVMVNHGDGMGRKSANVTAARALFVDLDGAPVEPVLSGPLPPRIVVESSPGKWHCYWPIVDLPLDRFTDAQKALAARFDGDPKVHDRARVMRLPGFQHRKGEPFQTRLVSCNPSPLTWHEMVQAFDLRDRFRLPDQIPEGERNSQLFKLAASAAAQGVPQPEQLAKAMTMNAKRCSPPLAAQEVTQIVANAYRMPVVGGAGVPRALLDSPAYKAAKIESRALMPLAYRRATPAGLVTLPHSELGDWFATESQLERHRKFAVADGLMTIAVRGQKAMPKKGRGPKPHVYRFAIPPVYEGYSTPQIPPTNEGPEYLQAVGSEAVESSGSAGGQFSAANDGEAAA
jgi:hypothetical protein